MKKKLLKTLAFVAFGAFATSAYAQSPSESEIQDAIVADITAGWTTEGTVKVGPDGTSYTLGLPRAHAEDEGSITSPEFPISGDLLFIPQAEAWTGATWKNNIIIVVYFKFTDEEGVEQVVPVEHEFEINKISQNYYLSFEKPEGVPADATMSANIKLTGNGQNTISPGYFEITARELVIDENSEVNTERLALNVGRNIRLRVIRSFFNSDSNGNPKIYTLSLPFAFSQEWADQVFGSGTVVKEFCGVTEELDEDGDLTSNTTFNFKNTDFDHESSFPYLILPAQDTENPLFEGVVVSSNNHVATAAIGTEGGTYTFYGSLNKEHYDTEEGSIHILKDGQIWQCTSDDNTSFKGVRGYFHYEEPVDNNNPHILKQDDDSSVRFFNVQLFDDNYTDIKSVVTQTAKAGIYNMAGQKLNVSRAQLQKGFYIVDGAKVYVK